MKHWLFAIPMLWSVGCATTNPLAEHLRVANVVELEKRMAKAHVAAKSYTAELRLSYFGPEGRVRATASLAVQRPGSFRYELQGPHGGVLHAFATNGRELQLADLKASRFFQGPATPDNIDAMFGIAKLGLGPQGWVSLLFGEVPIEKDATLRYDETVGRFVLEWERDGQVHRVEVDPESHRATGAWVLMNGKEISQMHIQSWDAQGLPARIRMHVAVEETDLEVILRDVDYPEKLDPDLFELQPQSKVVPEYIGPG